MPRPLYHARPHGLREVHDAGESICDGGVDGDVHSQARQALLIFARRTAARVYDQYNRILISKRK